MKPPFIPPPDVTTAAWWAATREHRLTVQECATCAARQHPPRPVCIRCGDERLGLIDAAGTGRVDSHTVVHRAPSPDLEVPYVIARVRLDEGVILLTRLEHAEPDSWRIGDRVRVAWVDLTDERALPIFVPADERSGS